MIITGHKGFIGSKLHKIFPGAIGIDLKDGMNLLTCELPKEETVIYHLAAQSSVESSWHDPLHDLDNIRITARLVSRYPNARIIYANSAGSLDQSSPYGFSKWAAGEYLKKFHKNYVICIFPNIYGEGSRSVVDIFKGKDSVNIYGDGKNTRDYVHVDDIVDGLVKARDWPTGEYYFGSGKSLSVLELAGQRRTTHLPARRESKEVSMSNTTPNWQPKINVMEYLK